MSESGPESAEGPRIKKFIPKPRKVGTGFVTRQATNSERKPYDSERRPFNRDSGRSFERPSAETNRTSFTKPWDEERAGRIDPAARLLAADGEGEASSPVRIGSLRTYDSKPRFGGDRPSFSNKPAFGKSRFSGDRPSSRPSSGNDRPSFRRNDEGSSDTRSPRREFTPASLSTVQQSATPAATARAKPFQSPAPLEAANAKASPANPHSSAKVSRPRAPCPPR